MSIYKNLKDSMTKRLADPPNRKMVKCKCRDCDGTGVCSKCQGTPDRTRSVIVKLILLPVAFILIVIWANSSASDLGWRIFNLIAMLIFFYLPGCFLIITLVGCQCLSENLLSFKKNPKDGKCIGCFGKGYKKENLIVEGTTILNALEQTFEADKIVKDAISNSLSLKELEKHINKSLKLNPKHFVANGIKGLVLFKNNNFNKALEYLLIAEEINPDNVLVKKLLCIVYENLGDTLMSERKFIELADLGLKQGNRKQLIATITAGAAAGLIASFVPFLDE